MAQNSTLNFRQKFVHSSISRSWADSFSNLMNKFPPLWLVELVCADWHDPHDCICTIESKWLFCFQGPFRSFSVTVCNRWTIDRATKEIISKVISTKGECESDQFNFGILSDAWGSVFPDPSISFRHQLQCHGAKNQSIKIEGCAFMAHYLRGNSRVYFPFWNFPIAHQLDE